MRRYFFIFLLLLPFSLLAENASNVRVRQNGKEIIITYDLAKPSRVELFVSINGESFFKSYKVSGAIGNSIRSGDNLEITWYPLDEFGEEEISMQNVRFIVRALGPYESYSLPAIKGGQYQVRIENGIYKPVMREGGKKSTETFITADIARALSVEQKSYGLMFGQTYYGVGWFVNGRYFNFPKSAEEISEDKITPFYSGRMQTSILVAHGGLVLDFVDLADGSKNRFNTFGVYAGLGYGLRRMLWETTNGDWIIQKHTFYKGVSANFGLIGSIFGLTLKAGVNFIKKTEKAKSEYLDIEAGIGWMF